MHSSYERGITAARRGITALTACSLAALAGCDVVNPGQVLDEDLDNPSALRILVDGLIGDVSVSLGSIQRLEAPMGGDLTGTASFSEIVRHWHGEANDEDAGGTDVIRRTVVLADEVTSRVEGVLGAQSPLLGEAYLWAGFINRIAGDIFCDAVIEGGPSQPRSVYHERAVERFTSAIDIATAASDDETLTAAYAGRAHSRMQLGDWAGAVADAGEVQDNDFVVEALFHTTTNREQNQYWRHSVFSPGLNVRWTFFQWYADNFPTDSRVTYYPHSANAADGSGPFYLVGKYEGSSGADVPLAKGWEMRLIEAEDEIVNGDWATGLGMVNDVRDAFGQTPWPGTSQAEALDALKRERAIMLWVEARRAGDLWRWGNTAAGDPIIAQMYADTPAPAQYVGGAGGLPIAQADRAICIPLSINVKSTNPNLQ